MGNLTLIYNYGRLPPILMREFISTPWRWMEKPTGVEYIIPPKLT